MAEDNKKKKTSTTSNKKKTTSANSSKSKSVATKKTSTKNSSKGKTTVAKKTTGSSSQKKSTTSKPKTTQPAKKKTTVPKKEQKVEVLEKREPDLEKTILISKEETEVINKKVVSADEDAKTILGLELPTGDDKIDKEIRRKQYRKDALAFALIIPIVDLFAMLFIERYSYLIVTNYAVVNYLITLAIDFVLIFVVTYLVDYAFGEDTVKRIKKKK